MRRYNWFRSALFTISLILIIFLVCGCESNQKDRELLFKALKDSKIISKSMEQIDLQHHYYYASEWCYKTNYYIYKDKNSKMIAVTYRKSNNSNDDYDHLIEVYKDVKINKDIRYLSSDDDEGCNDTEKYSYSDDRISFDERYSFEKSKEYKAREKSSFFKGKYYSLELVD